MRESIPPVERAEPVTPASRRSTRRAKVGRPGFVPFARPFIGVAEIAEVVETLESGWLTTGPKVKEFERRFAAYAHAPFAVAVNSCTAGLHLALLASGIGPGDEVVTTPLTFCATANVVVHCGATPVFADIDADSMNLDPVAARAAITDRTRALLPVHFAGRPARAADFRALAGRLGLSLIEDAAHCLEGAAPEGKIGAMADFTAFSFYATKNLTTGEGGMVTTANEQAAARMRVAALHGMSHDAWSRYSRGGRSHYDVVMAGFKYNMMDLQAALGLAQLARIETLQQRRVGLWRRYDEGLAGLPLVVPAPAEPGSVHARHLYTVLVDDARCGWSRDALMSALAERGISTSIHFRALHLHSFFAERFGLRRGMFPHAEFISDRTLSLPFFADMRDDEVDHVIETLAALLREGPRHGGA